MTDRLSVLRTLACGTLSLVLAVLSVPPLIVACVGGVVLVAGVTAADWLIERARRLQD